LDWFDESTSVSLVAARGPARVPTEGAQVPVEPVRPRRLIINFNRGCTLTGRCAWLLLMSVVECSVFFAFEGHFFAFKFQIFAFNFGRDDFLLSNFERILLSNLKATKDTGPRAGPRAGARGPVGLSPSPCAYTPRDNQGRQVVGPRVNFNKKYCASSTNLQILALPQISRAVRVPRPSGTSNTRRIIPSPSDRKSSQRLRS
jgi:hypothetical protein